MASTELKILFKAFRSIKWWIFDLPVVGVVTGKPKFQPGTPKVLNRSFRCPVQPSLPITEGRSHRISFSCMKTQNVYLLYASMSRENCFFVLFNATIGAHISLCQRVADAPGTAKRFRTSRVGILWAWHWERQLCKQSAAQAVLTYCMNPG